MVSQIKKIAVIVTAGSALFMAAAMPVLAEDSPSSPGARLQQRCTQATQRIETAVARYNNNKEKHVQQYENLAVRLADLGEKLKARGYDISKLQADGKILRDKIAKFAADYADTISKLEATKQYACGSSQGAFKQALKTAQDQLKVVKADSVDIRNYYQTVVRPDVQAVKAQKPAPTPVP